MSTWTLRFEDGQREQPEIVFQRQAELNHYIEALTVSDVLKIRVYNANKHNMCGKTYVYHYLM